MPCIRRRYHYAKIYIDDQAPELLGRELVGSMLDVRLRNGDFKRIPFGGFLRNPLSILSPLKIDNVEAYADQGFYEGGWIELGGNAIILGAYIRKQAWVVVNDGVPVAWCEL